MVWQDELLMNSPSASASESASRKVSKWRWNVSHVCLCACYWVVLGYIETVGPSPYISLVFPQIFMARGRYLKYFQRFKRKILVSTTHWNAGIKCLKVKPNLWLLHPIHFSNGTLCSKCLFSSFFLPELMFVVSIQTKRAWWRFFSSLTKKFSSSGIILTDDKWAPNPLLVGIRPMKCLEIDWFL